MSHGWHARQEEVGAGDAAGLVTGVKARSFSVQQDAEAKDLAAMEHMREQVQHQLEQGKQVLEHEHAGGSSTSTRVCVCVCMICTSAKTAPRMR